MGDASLVIELFNCGSASKETEEIGVEEHDVSSPSIDGDVSGMWDGAAVLQMSARIQQAWLLAVGAMHGKQERGISLKQSPVLCLYFFGRFEAERGFQFPFWLPNADFGMSLLVTFWDVSASAPDWEPFVAVTLSVNVGGCVVGKGMDKCEPGRECFKVFYWEDGTGLEALWLSPSPRRALPASADVLGTSILYRSTCQPNHETAPPPVGFYKASAAESAAWTDNPDVIRAVVRACLTS